MIRQKLFFGVWVLVAGVVSALGQEGKASTADDVSQLKRALSEHRVVAFTYHGYARTVEPHALGKGTDGKPVLLGWQISGGSSSEPPPGWRVFLLAEIAGLKLTDTTFAKPRPDYQNHKVGRGLKSVEAEVTAAE